MRNIVRIVTVIVVAVVQAASQIDPESEVAKFFVNLFRQISHGVRSAYRQPHYYTE